ncbi:MAG: replicative DNA helicase, partial [FCB group bacterium]
MGKNYFNNMDSTYPFPDKIKDKRTETSPNVILETLGSRIPPHSNDAEVAVLGAMMLDKSAIAKVIELLDVDSFYNEAHRIIFDTILHMFQERISVDIVTLGEELSKRKLLEVIGGTFYLLEINSKTPTAANIEHHARIVQERYLKRMLITTTGKILNDCYEDSTDALEEIDVAEAEIFKLSDKRFHKSYVPIKKIAHNAFGIIEGHVGQDREMIGIPSGFRKLDEILGGFHDSDFIVIAGRPSMGKTALALSIARNIAVEYKKKVAFFSIEMDSVQLVLRLLSAEARVNGNDIRVGRVSQESFSKIAKTIHRIADAPIIIDDSPSLSIMELRAKTRRMIAEHQVQLVIVDYLQLMHAPKTESREREISMISQSFKQIAKELNIPVIALAQLNRSVESRQDKRPMLSDLRESGSIEQDADVVLFVHRPEYYKILTYDDEDKRSTEGTAE